MPFLSYKEKKIFYRIKETESKSVIIFIHGSGGSSNTWKSQFDLEINYDLIAIDLPSHNNSNEFSELSLDLYVDVIRYLIKSLNYDNVILCGHSLGGAIIQQYYFSYPKEISGLILCGTGGRLRVAPIILNSLRTNYQEFLDSLPAGAFYRKTPRELVDNYVQETSKIKAEVTYEDFKICDNFDTIDKTDSIEVP
jgi:pimeloyl-ACP methyl ester carboxylesterase